MLATKAEIAEALKEREYWRKVAAIMGVTVYGWNALDICEFLEKDGGRFTLSRAVVESILKHTLPASSDDAGGASSE